MQNSPNDEIQRANQVTTLKIIWAALFCSQILYIYVATITAKNFTTESTLLDTSDPMTFPLILMSVVALAAAAYLPKILSKNSSRLIQGQGEFSRYFVPFMVRLALLESVALYGFVLAIIHHDPKRMLLFTLASMIGYIASYPSAEKVQAGF